MGTEDAYITVNWEYNKFRIVYNPNGGYVENEFITATYDQRVTISDATREGYNLLGWSSTGDENSIDYRAGDIINVRQSLTLDAIWQISDYTVTFDGNNGIAGEVAYVPLFDFLKKREVQLQI